MRRNCMRAGLPVVAVALLSGTGASGAIVEDFSGATDFASRFRVINTQTGNTLVQNGTVLLGTGNPSPTPARIVVYDTTPGDGTATSTTFAVAVGSPLTVSIDVANITGAGTSVGFYFADPAAEGVRRNYMALLNVNNSGSSERVRFASDAALDAFNANGTLVDGVPGTGDGGITVNDPAYKTISATYSILSDTLIELKLSAGGLTSTRQFTVGGVTLPAALTQVEVGFRISPPASSTLNTLNLDNFTISGALVPEPGTGLLLMSAGLLGLRRRRA